MEYLLVYLMIGFLIAAALVLREGTGWRQATLCLLTVTIGWLLMLFVVWFFYVAFSTVKVDEADEKEEVKP